MITECQKKLLQGNLKMILDGYSEVKVGQMLHPCDGFFAYRILLGRMPSNAQEFDQFTSNITYRQFLANLLESREFDGQLGFMPSGQRMMTDINGFRFWFNSSDREMGALMATARYEQETVRLLKKIIKPGMHCLDVGAQTGYFTCLLSSLVGSDGFVWAFEPLPQNVDLITVNIQENNFESRVKLAPYACADVTGTLAVEVVSGMVVASPNGKICIECKKIDDIVNDKIDFCKIDIEGHEPKALKGMNNILSEHHPIILTEFNQYWLKQAGSSIIQFAELLRSYNYNLWNVTQPLTVFDEKISYDILSNFNVIAIPCEIDIHEYEFV